MALSVLEDLEIEIEREKLCDRILNAPERVTTYLCEFSWSRLCPVVASPLLGKVVGVGVGERGGVGPTLRPAAQSAAQH